MSEVEWAASGYSCETIIVDRALVLRLPPLGDGIFPEYDLALQAAVQEAAGRAGLPVAPARYEPDPDHLGAPFLAMDFMSGAVPNEFTAADPWLTGLPEDRDRRAVWDGFLDALSTVHRTPLAGLGLRTGIAAELDWWGRYVDWATEGDPPAPLVEVLAWCRTHQPPTEPAAGLLWGDVRLGNVVFDPATLRPAAVLDWDMASAGPAELDLAWFLALEGLQASLSGMAVAGFGTRAEAIAAVEAAQGRPLVDLDWYEVFALARASAVSTRMAWLARRDGERSMFRLGQDPTLQEALARIGAS